MTDPFAPLIAELDTWAKAGRQAVFWLRDDDAVAPTAALDQLLEATAAVGVPVALAVIPATSGVALAERLADAPLVSVAVHGWQHKDHSAGQGKKAELGAHRPKGQVLAEIQRGAARLAFLHPDRFVPVLVPPWNRIDAHLVPHLTAAGFAALSVFGPEAPGPIAHINSHVDLIDWHGTRGGRDPAHLVTEIIARLGVMVQSGGTMGFLTHHLVHDAAAWAFVESLLRATHHPGARWAALPELIADQTLIT